MSGSTARQPIAPNTIMAELFYVIGASGVGKDSLIDYARQHVAEFAPVVFTHRYITRPADAGGENHVALSEREFNCRRRMGCFAMSWYSHGTCYGIGIEINQWLAKGLSVVVNGSREYIDVAAKSYPELRPVLITADPEQLMHRLRARGREDETEISERLAMAQLLDEQTVHPRLERLSNNGSPVTAGERLLSLIQRSQDQQCA